MEHRRIGRHWLLVPVTCPLHAIRSCESCICTKSQYSVQKRRTLDVSKLVHLEIAPHSALPLQQVRSSLQLHTFFFSSLRPRFLLLFLPGPPLLFCLRFPLFQFSCRFPCSTVYPPTYPFLPFLTFPMLRRFCPSSFLFGLDCCSFRYVLHPAPPQKSEKEIRIRKYSGFIVFKANVIVNFFFAR